MRVALADGTVAKSGGKVIKNVAGYDLAKLFAGSFGTLGAIVEVSVRLHPLAARDGDRRAASAATRTSSRARGRGARRARRSSIDGLDVRWADGRGAVLARFAGRRAATRRPRRAERLLRERGLEAEIVDDDDDALGASSAPAQRGAARGAGSPGCRRGCRRSARGGRRWAARSSAARRSGSRGSLSRSRRRRRVERLRRALAPCAVRRARPPAGDFAASTRWGRRPGARSRSCAASRSASTRPGLQPRRLVGGL